MNSLDFSHEEVERASRYHRPLYAALAVSFALSVGVYSLLAWTWIGDRLWAPFSGLGWAGAAAAWAGARSPRISSIKRCKWPGP